MISKTPYKIVTIIPARGGSKRLPNKNMALLLGKPLIYWSIQFARPFGLENCYLSTDSATIKDYALNLGAQVIDRPAELATDTTTTVAVLQHAVEVLNIATAYVMLLQPTNPFRLPTLAQDAMALLDKESADSLFTVSLHDKKLGKIKEHKYEPFNYHFGQRSQDLEPLYYENGLLYISTPEIIKTGNLIGPNHTPMIVNHPYASVDIDTAFDLDYAEFIGGFYNYQ